MEYLKAKEISSGLKPIDVKKKFRFLTTEPKLKFCTNYEYFKKNGKGHSLMVRDEETKKLKSWDKLQKLFVEIDEKQFWYNDEAGKKKCYLDQIYVYDCEFETEQSISIWKGTKVVKVKEFKFEATYSQNEAIKTQIGMYGLKKWYILSQQGKPYLLFEQGDVSQEILNKPVEQKQEVKQPVTQQPIVEDQVIEEKIVDIDEESLLSMKEKSWLAQAKKENLEVNEFKAYLESQNVVTERVELLTAMLMG